MKKIAGIDHIANWKLLWYDLKNRVTAYGLGAKYTVTPDAEPGKSVGDGLFPLTCIVKSAPVIGGGPKLLTITVFTTRVAVLSGGTGDGLGGP